MFLCYRVPTSIIPIFGTNPIREIWAKMLSANQITGFLNQLYIQNKFDEIVWFLHADKSFSWFLHADKLFWWLWSKISVVTLIKGL